MILINLLPPELRRKRSSSAPKMTPIMMGAVAGLVLSLMTGGLYLYIHQQIPKAQAQLADLEEELTQKQGQAAKINDMKAKIAEFGELRETLVNLLQRKVYWARTLDDFANYLTGPWSVDGFQARCLSLNVDPVGVAAKKDAPVVYKFRWRMKLIGDDETRAGEYVRSFFQTTQESDFWKTYNFAGKPEDLYRGDTPSRVAEFRKVAIDLAMDWDRVKVITKPVAAKGKP